MMMQDAKAAGPRNENDCNRKIQIDGFRPHVKGTLRGFFVATMPDGMVFHDLMLHESNGSRWIQFPVREWIDSKGVKQYVRFVEFRDRQTAGHFRDVMLAALERYLAGGRT
jgi:hypothetical protein